MRIKPNRVRNTQGEVSKIIGRTRRVRIRCAQKEAEVQRLGLGLDFLNVRVDWRNLHTFLHSQTSCVLLARLTLTWQCAAMTLHWASAWWRCSSPLGFLVLAYTILSISPFSAYSTVTRELLIVQYSWWEKLTISLEVNEVFFLYGTPFTLIARLFGRSHPHERIRDSRRRDLNPGSRNGSMQITLSRDSSVRV